MMNRGDGNRGQMMRRPTSSLGRPTGFGLWDPWQEMAEMRRRMDDMFSRFFGPGMNPPTIPGPTNWSQIATAAGMEPDVDVYDNENEYVVHAALPGCRAEDINLQATEDSVMLTCEYRSPFENEKQQAPGANQHQGTNQNQGGGPTALRQSRFSTTGRFEFSYTFPDEIDPNQISADFKNGRLELKVPKVQVEGRGKPIKIPIQGAASAQPSIQSGKTQSTSGGGAEGNVAEPFVPAGGGQAEQRAAHETKSSLKSRGSRAKTANPSPS